VAENSKIRKKTIVYLAVAGASGTWRRLTSGAPAGGTGAATMEMAAA
jgi:hypothetical protein